ncbi:unnamed protein product [Arabis nemorensis]|uniref:Uncharacterized protein n=1 Tax=Arabis nemorensis TaxID=586526 RepID=A0A565CTY2_9BRAS|nr:unnamed protein product [Arabis nemorensis]
MESETVKFGGQRELGGALDLITQYKLLPHHEFFCKRSLPESLSDAHYLHNVVGDTEIRKGEGMQLDQLLPPNASSHIRDTSARIQPFVLDELKEAFELNDTAPVELPPAEKGAPTVASKSKKFTWYLLSLNFQKRKNNGDEDLDDIQRHKKSKHKSSKLDEMGVMKVAG